MTENRNGLIVDARLTEANGTAERSTALDMIEDNARPGSTVGADKNYDTADFVAGCRERGCTPHVSQNNTNRRSAIDARTTRHPGYRISTIKRKQIEEPFGWMKTVGGLRKTRHCGRGLVEWFFVLTAAAYNLVRIPRIMRNGISLSGAPKMRQNMPNISPIAPDYALRLSYQPEKIDRIDLALNLFQQPASDLSRARGMCRWLDPEPSFINQVAANLRPAPAAARRRCSHASSRRPSQATIFAPSNARSARTSTLSRSAAKPMTALDPWASSAGDRFPTRVDGRTGVTGLDAATGLRPLSHIRKRSGSGLEPPVPYRLRHLSRISDWYYPG